ncbi:Di-copper centre-containing protein [Hysterangium stoloniferum]|nr:Di-copper centre-containing protein [Hysterangium stoloniferum]
MDAHIGRPVLVNTPVESSGKCKNPSVRREWRTLTDAQKEAWTDAILCLNSIPSNGLGAPVSTASVTSKPPVIGPPLPIPPHNSSASMYDAYSYVHIALNDQVRFRLFLPWHRYFGWSFEQALSKYCGYNGGMPYWDWTLDANDFEHGSIFDPTPKTGLGGFGDPTHQSEVLDGAFAGIPLTYPVPHTLQRKFTPYPFVGIDPILFPDQNLAAVSTIQPTRVQQMSGGFRGDYKGFQSWIEGMQGPHMSVHLVLGGDMGGDCPPNSTAVCRPNPDPMGSANDPLFWLHHEMVDKLWNQWQRSHPENYWAFEAGITRDLYTWPRYPNGAPPAMHVRTFLSISGICNLHSPPISQLDYVLPTAGVLMGNYTVGDMLHTRGDGPLCYVYE